MRLTALLGAVASFLFVAGLTVHLAVRASLRAYDLGRQERDLVWLRQRQLAARADVESLYRPAALHEQAARLRALRSGGELPPDL